MKKNFSLDNLYYILSTTCTILFASIVLAIIVSLLWNSRASLKHFGLSFFTSPHWNIPIFEVSNISTDFDENKITIYFTAPLKENQTPEVILYKDSIKQNIKVDTQQRSITVISDAILQKGAYKLIIPKELQDIYSFSMPYTAEWHGIIHKKTIISQKLTDSQGNSIQISSDENYRNFGILSFVVGTVLSSLLALLIGFPLALASALCLTEFLSPRSAITLIFSALVDLLAGIPSVIYGLWALFFIVPKLGANLLTASLVLSVMTIPYAASLIREAIALVPMQLKLAGSALGASRFKIITQIILPYARSGIVAGILLTLGRALGETLAVTMVIGNRNQIPTSLFSPTQTIASLIANEYGEASGLKQSALIEAGLVLIIITLIFSLLGKCIIHQTNKNPVPKEGP
ncbi:phosphate ABC transporter, permease protein PstC [Brevinema andersonii]|uniref:Phosphate transport system permease protein n=1 Tax=Brevinema andersonii TaxID=34097 RepID=A0A1I1EWF8_BREAD|nr:phosphate ABC transporter permease subunit PstC [Brevinema andersonii]SFB91434.1 phosphate ABC transporter, permease protein PstC [Brevinema andersonii]